MIKSNRFLLRYSNSCVLAMIAATFMGCTSTGTVGDPAATHAEVAIGDQQDLWEQHASGRDFTGLQAGTGEITIAQVQEIEAIPADKRTQQMPPQIDTQVLMERVPDQAFGDKPLETTGRVVGVQAEMLTIEAPEGTVKLQTRVGGRTLTLTEGDEVDVEIRSGSAFQRSDYVQIRGEEDALGYALVGGEEPVTIELSFFELTARQDGSRTADNSMGVTVQVGDESQRIDELGEVLHFEAAGLSVQVLASIAADEKTAAILPESHRLEIVVWPSRN